MDAIKKSASVDILLSVTILSMFLPGCTKLKYGYIEKYLGSWNFQCYYYTQNVTLDTES